MRVTKKLRRQIKRIDRSLRAADKKIKKAGKPARKWAKRVRRIKMVGPLLRNRKRMGTAFYSVLHLASDLKK